jgi:RHS repeat-associated protein
MRKIFYILILMQFLATVPAFAQLIVPSNNQNYIYVLSPQTPVKTRSQLYNKPADSMAQSVQYFDGLGRPKQQIDVQSSQGKRDMIVPIIYDQFGRDSASYLPYASAVNNNGAFIATTIAITQCRNFYRPGSGFTNIAIDSFPQAVKVFENSPLNRVFEQGAPGLTWQPKAVTSNNTSSGHTQKFANKTNAASEVMLWNVNSSNNCVQSSFYAVNQLYITEITEENNNITREYNDKEGRVVLKTSINGTETLYTYYVYDDFGLLRYVLPPRAIKTLGGATTLTPATPLVRDLCYYYAYDSRQRMISKQIPGAGPVYMVYDLRDRLVLSQDSVQRTTSKWLFTRYDALNRPIITGEITKTGTQAVIQADINTKYTGGTPRAYYEDRNTSNKVIGYTENSYPIPADGTITYLAATYYDTYGFPSYQPFLSANNISTYRDSEGSSIYYYDNAKGLVTGQRVLGIGTKWLTTINFYDDQSRVIQTIDTNHMGGRDVLSNNYDFIGKVLQSNFYHNVTYTSITVIKKMEYDHAGRVKKQKMQLTGSYSMPETVISEMTYNELGQLVNKKLAAGYKKLDYLYNIRGWLRKINDPATLGSDLFGMELTYDVPFSDLTSTKQFNGNIASMKWQTTFITGPKGYTYQYDSINRLRQAIFYEYTTSWTANDKYSEKNIFYDQNGNILKLTRNGLLSPNKTAGTIDNLTYYYKGNQLIGANDVVPGSNYGDFSDGGMTAVPVAATPSTWEYAYDGNGNLTKDVNKNFQGIQYNRLNQPIKLYNNLYNRIEYAYDAAGTKLRKSVYPYGNLSTQTDYVGNFVYENKAPAFMLFDEGRIIFTGGLQAEYYLKDHLGNVRVTFTPAGVIRQVNSYYPFGMNISGLTDSPVPNTKNKYLYNGKEMHDDWSLNLLDYGARFYDSALGRWSVIDNKTEKYSSVSPYIYCLNDPIIFLDPDGNEIYYSQNGTKLGQVGTNTDVRVVNSSVTNAQAATYIQNSNTKSLNGSSVAYASYFTTVADVTNDAALQTWANNGRNCYNAATAQLSEEGVTQTGPGNAINTKVDANSTLTAEPIGGSILIQTQLNNGEPVMVGVEEINANGTSPDPGNTNSATGHFVVIRSSTVSADGTVTFNYLDNASTSLGKNANNNFTLNTTTGEMQDNTIPQRGSYETYDVTEVRKNQ